MKKKIPGPTEGRAVDIQQESFRDNVPNWKMPGLDGIPGFLFKRFTAIHNRLAVQTE